MRSKLFVPASRPELFPKALASQADAISFDLEDSVLPGRKQYARDALAEFFASDTMAQAREQGGKSIIVRVNALGSDEFMADLQVACHSNVDLVNIPMIESAQDVLRAVELMAHTQTATAGTRILANIETPTALHNATAIASAHERVWGLQLGLGDMFEPLGITRYDARNVHAILFALRMASATAGCVVFDSAYADVGNPQGYREEALLARRLGYMGKTCIHPSQIAIANEVFSPTEEEIAWAGKVVAAAAVNEVNGAYLLDGKMIDAPFVARAHDVLRQARQTQSGSQNNPA